MCRVVDSRLSSRGTEGNADGWHAPDGRRPGRVRARAEGPTGGGERGRQAQGARGNVGEPPLVVTLFPAWGTGRPQALAWSGAFARAGAREGHHARGTQARSSGRARRAQRPARGREAGRRAGEAGRPRRPVRRKRGGGKATLRAPPTHHHSSRWRRRPPALPPAS